MFSLTRRQATQATTLCLPCCTMLRSTVQVLIQDCYFTSAQAGQVVAAFNYGSDMVEAAVKVGTFFVNKPLSTHQSLCTSCAAPVFLRLRCSQAAEWQAEDVGRQRMLEYQCNCINLRSWML